VKLVEREVLVGSKGTAIVVQWIPGLMFGVEFPTRMLIIDLGILRLMFIWGITEEERKYFED